jgi:hypothetical protein
MRDKELAQAARALAARLHRYAKERDEESRKAIASLHHELCDLWRTELAEIEAAEQGTAQ